MPSFAIYNDQLITATDIYKFDIDTDSDFKCFTCERSVQFRKSRNADNNYTEHFYHPNTVKDTHIECEKATVDREENTWHNMMSGFVKKDTREIMRKNSNRRHFVDTYCHIHEKGVEFQNSPIKEEDVRSRDETSDLDWIFNVESQYIRKVKIGDKIVCEIPHDSWEKSVAAVKNNIFLYTGYREWISLIDAGSYRVEIEGKPRNVWIGIPCTFEDVCNETCIHCNATPECIEYFKSNTREIETVRMMYARCKRSMYLMDDIHRDYVNKHDFKQGDILAIRSVAGSGKTTTLLTLAKIHREKKILYTAFNKSLVEDIKVKLVDQHITNVKAITIDALVREIFVAMSHTEPDIKTLTPQNVMDTVPTLRGKPYGVRKDAVNKYSDFCKQVEYSTAREYCSKVLMKDKHFMLPIWMATRNRDLFTFEGLRKMSLNEHWFKDYVEGVYDMIMVDETQDFDMLMLRMLLDDTSMPKVFVGDPRQAIYEWRGAINGFNYMPSNSIVLEFYSTFRVGDPACEIIRQRFTDCWMISKSKNETLLTNDPQQLKDQKYTYLFRTWRYLLTAARSMKSIYIPNYEEKVRSMRRQHSVIRKGLSSDNDQYEDDLPNFLKELSEEDLETMLSEIEDNRVSPSKCTYKFYTIHGYKGLEDDNVRIADDIDTSEEVNLWYVALTRGRKMIVEDVEEDNSD